MVSIVFDEETRQFAASKNGKGGKKKSTFGTTVGGFGGQVGAHLMNNRGTYLSAGGGALIGGAGARALAKRKALEKGLEPGTPEYKRFVNMATAGGAAVGGGAGALVYRKGRPAYDWTKKTLSEMKTSAQAAYRKNRAITPGMMSSERAAYEKAWEAYHKKNPKKTEAQFAAIWSKKH